MLKVIPIYLEDIKRKADTMHDKDGRHDLMGQILVAYGVKVHQHAATPACQNTILAPFSEGVRGKANNTEVCMKILRNASLLSPKQQVEAANNLLDEHGIYLEIQ